MGTCLSLQVNDEQPSDDDIDFNKRLYPLDHYRDNYSELVDQLFKSVSRGNQLQSLLPDILQVGLFSLKIVWPLENTLSVVEIQAG